MFVFFGGVSLGLYRVGLGFVWGKFQILGLFKGVLKVVLVSCFGSFGG